MKRYDDIFFLIVVIIAIAIVVAMAVELPYEKYAYDYCKSLGYSDGYHPGFGSFNRSAVCVQEIPYPKAMDRRHDQ